MNFGLSELIFKSAETFDVKLNKLLQAKRLLKEAIVTPGQVDDEELFRDALLWKDAG